MFHLIKYYIMKKFKLFALLALVMSLGFMTSCQTLDAPKNEKTQVSKEPTREQQLKVAQDAANKAVYVLAREISSNTGYDNKAEVDASSLVWDSSKTRSSFKVVLKWKAKDNPLSTSPRECVVEGNIEVTYSGLKDGSYTLFPATFYPTSSNDWARNVAGAFDGDVNRLKEARIFDVYAKK